VVLRLAFFRHAARHGGLSALAGASRPGHSLYHGLHPPQNYLHHPEEQQCLVATVVILLMSYADRLFSFVNSYSCDRNDAGGWMKNRSMTQLFREKGCRIYLFFG
jgi:hypothetical protein